MEMNNIPTKVVDANNSIERDYGINSPVKSAVKASTGGWKYAILLLANQGLATLAFFGAGVNLVLFLTRVLEYNNANAANTVSIWMGTVYMFSLVAAFLSDSYWGRYLTCAIFQVILLLGLMLLSITTSTFLIKPSGCGDGKLACNPTSKVGIIMFNLSIYLVALGYGGHQPTIATLGADQFDEANPKESHSKAMFFAYFYFALNSGSLFSNTVLVYFEDSGKWTVGFWASAACAFVGLVMFLSGTRGYRYFKPCGNPLTRVAQVITATMKKWRVVPSDGENLFELQGSESAIKGSRKIKHSEEFRFLDKAATMTEKELSEQASHDPWRLCTITQVEEVKCILKMLPIWLCTIAYSVVFTQMQSLFVEQGDVMKRTLGKFHIPAASMSAFDIISVLISTFAYRQLLVPVAGRYTGNPKGLSELQRMGVGLVIGILAMIAAGISEFYRLKHIIPETNSSTLSIFWQIPQYVLVGASEVFMYVGQLEFFNNQAPDGLKSFGSCLCMVSMSLGNFVSTMLVDIVMLCTARGDKPGWIPSNNLNDGHMEYFYFLIAGLTTVDFVAYLIMAKWHKGMNFDDGKEHIEHKQIEDVLEKV